MIGKKRTGLLIVAALTLMVCGCQKERHFNVNPSDMYGLWVKKDTKEYWRFKTNGRGVTWDAEEDISEAESNLTFTWEIEEDELTCVFRGEMGQQAVPKVYVIKEITKTTMRWEDYYGTTEEFTKVNSRWTRKRH